LRFLLVTYMGKSNTESAIIKARLKVTIVFAGIALFGCLSELAENAPHDPNLLECPVEYVEDHVNTYALVGNWKFLGFLGVTSTQIASPPCVASSTKNNEFSLDLEFSSDTNLVGGNARINSYSGRYHLSTDNGLKLDSIVATKMGGKKELVDFEQRFLTALHESKSYRIEHNILTLFNGLSGDKMLFVAIPEN